MSKKVSNDLMVGLAHNLNNLISIILSRTQLLEKKIKDVKYISDIRMIGQAAKEASSMAKRLQKSPHVKEMSQKWINLNDLLSDVVELTRSVWQHQAQRKGITIHVALELGDIPKIRVHAPQLKDVFINFILNAVDAIAAKSGIIRIKTIMQNDAIKISVSDTGVGMSEETKHQLFTPYFSTKGPAGTGLGLITSKEIIQQHDGTLEVKSKLNVGTTFVITFPFPTRPSIVRVPLEQSESLHSKSVMLVDDETDYRNATAELLVMEGYDVEQAANGSEALDKLKEKNFDVVLSDMNMPGISGFELAKHIKSFYQNTKIILISGGQDRVSIDQVKSLNIDAWLSKPCKIEDITKTIKEMNH